MNILFLTKETPYPPDSGARMRSWHYALGLRRAGHLTILCFGRLRDNPAGMAASEIFDLGYEFFPADDLPPQGALSRLKALFTNLPYAVWSRRSQSMRDKVSAMENKNQYDLIVCDGIHQALNIPEELRHKTILDEHNVESTILGRYVNTITNPLEKLYALIEWSKFQRFEKRLWPQFSEIHVCSEIDRQKVIARSGHPRVKVIPNGIDINTSQGSSSPHTGIHSSDEKTPNTLFPPPGGEATNTPFPPPGGEATNTPFPPPGGEATNTPFPPPGGEGQGGGARTSRLVYTGLMSWRPNEDAALYFVRDIYPLIKKITSSPERDAAINQSPPPGGEGQGGGSPRSSLKLYLVGKDPTPAVEDLRRSDRSIEITGYVKDIKQYIEAADVFIVPLRIGSGTRLKILEAMALGRPVVSTSIGCEGLDVTPGENIFIADTPEDFSRRVLDLLQDRDLAQRIGRAGKKLVEEKYNWDTIEQALADLIASGSQPSAACQSC